MTVGGRYIGHPKDLIDTGKRSMTKFKLAALAAVLVSPALADGDAEAGETQFNRQCTACHVAANADGDVLAGRNARTGPNLFGVAGRGLAAIDGFRYSDSIIELGEMGTTWSEENFDSFVQDPTGWMRGTMDDGRARSKMAYRVRDEQHARDIYAFLVSLGAATE